MRLGQLLGSRFNEGTDDLILYEGPLGPRREAMPLADVAIALFRIANVLSVKSRTPSQRVGILSNHRIETYLSVMACAISGRTFVPLNPKFPTSRLEQIIELGEVDVILYDSSSLSALSCLDKGHASIDISALATNPSTNLEQQAAHEYRLSISEEKVDPQHTCYLMFTSGSTGVPKGVPISFANLLAYVQGLTKHISLARGLRFSQFFDLAFDLSIHDIFISNFRWGTLIAPTKVDLMMPSGYVNREKIDIWFSVPILGALIGKKPPESDGHKLQQMLFCGEALPMETVVSCQPWLDDGGEIWNLYGPTEATIAFTAAQITSAEKLSGTASIGQPFGSNEVLLEVDGNIRAATEVGEEGELLLGGPQVFDGYTGSPPSPFLEIAQKVWYRSGDLVRVETEGIRFRGRVDSQIKYRGYRVELGEIEVASRQAFRLQTVAAILNGSGSDGKIVLFYLSSESTLSINPSDLSNKIPSYMVPGEFIALEAMPTNVNGKIDRKALANLLLKST
jgi:D-alanine--poly(phosphoribitol) ligase subunit 1